MNNSPDMLQAIARAICLGEFVKIGLVTQHDLPKAIEAKVDENWREFVSTSRLVAETINRLVEAEAKLPVLSSDLTGVTVQ